jgi:hypothetical protein
MSRILAMLLVVVLLVASVPSAAHAGGHGPGRGLVGLAAFALFAPFIIAGEVLAHTVPRVVVAPGPVYYPPAPVYHAPPVYSSPPPVYSAPAAYARPANAAPVSTQSRVILYPHGRYVLQGDGVVTAYRWVWIPNPPVGPPPPPPA